MWLGRCSSAWRQRRQSHRARKVPLPLLAAPRRRGLHRRRGGRGSWRARRSPRLQAFARPQKKSRSAVLPPPRCRTSERRSVWRTCSTTSTRRWTT
eukprot:14628006-Alexandrium_andersonii.AAC.1